MPENLSTDSAPKEQEQTEYREFLRRKSQVVNQFGFEPLWVPDFLFDFQKSLVEWSLRKGRGAIFAGCGLGKGPMQFVWAENVVRYTNRPVLIVTTLGDSAQIVKEGEKFGVEIVRSKTGKIPTGAKIVVTNYERLHLFDPNDFDGVSANESSAIKDFASKTRDTVTEFFRTRPYRLLCTATPSPNDYVELGTSSEALGELGCQDMVTRFFKLQVNKDFRGWGRTKYLLRGHAEKDFWRWICSWARAVRKPSDLGFDDTLFILPDLVTQEHVVKANEVREGFLVNVPAISLEEQREERRRTIKERCEKVADLVNHNRPAVCWCHLNPEGDLLEKLIPGASQISGRNSDDEKEELFDAFASGQIRVLVTKGSIAAHGLNWQHCAHQTWFSSHSYEEFHQGVRRCWRFGQTEKVEVDVVASEGEIGVLKNLQNKSEKADRMFDQLVIYMNDQLAIERRNDFTKEMEVPSWL